MTMTLSNGQLPRKQLADQLDRLDTILDGLADALNGAVADAIKDGTQLAVQQAMATLLQHSAAQQQVAAQQVVSQPSLHDRIRQRIQPYRDGILSWLRSQMTELKSHFDMGLSLLSTALQLVWGLWQFRQMLSVSIVIGIAVALVSYCLPPVVSAFLCGLSGAGLGLAYQVRRWFQPRLLLTLS
jgi:hypothetical protein